MWYYINVKKKEEIKMKESHEALKTMTEDEFVVNELKKQEEAFGPINPILADLLTETEEEIREYYRSHKH